MIASTRALLVARWLAGLLLLLAAARATDVVIPIETFFSLPAIGNPELSPDGTKIAFLFPKDHRMALGLFDRKNNEARIVLEGVDESIAFFNWKGNEHFIFGADVNGSESYFIGVSDLTGKKIQRLSESLRRAEPDTVYGSVASIVNLLPDDPENIIMAGRFLNDSGGNTMLRDIGEGLALNRTREVVRYNIRTKGWTHLLGLSDAEYSRLDDFMTDNAGVIRLGRRSDNHEFSWLGRPTNQARFREIIKFPQHGYAELWEPLGFAADNQTLWILSREEQERGALYAFDTVTGQRAAALFVPPEGEIDHLVTDYHRQHLLGVAYLSDRIHYHWFDAGRQALQNRLEKTFVGKACHIVSSSADDLVHLVRVASDRDPGAYYVLDLKQPALAQFKRIRPDIDPAQMQPMSVITLKARDGIELHGYVTLPAGAQGKRVPLVIHPHGGPFGVRDAWGFNNEVQFLASRGYAVLQVNYRGSGGYGREFINQGRRQWGRAMQNDLTDAVKWAIDQGIADPARVAIYGASYGGYAALVGVTLTPDLYCCAVNYVGPSDLNITFKHLGDDAFTTDQDFSYQNQWVGDDKAYRDATSPVNWVENIRVPTLHVYGVNDPRVRIDHWKRLEAQLKKYNKPYTVITEENQGHGFRNEVASIHFYKSMEEFFARNLSAGHASASPPDQSKATESKP